MKLLPLSLPPATAMDRLALPLPFGASELLWRYPFGFSAPTQPPPVSLFLDFKTQLPTSLAPDPRLWSRDDVAVFLRWCEREFDLPQFDMDMFQMNGKAFCLLTKSDLGERSPGCGDVLHNVLQLLVRDALNLQRCLPSSPVTPTSRHYPFPPHPNTPNWLTTTTPDFQTPSLAHLVHQGNSVTLSPAPSVESQSGSPQHVDHNPALSCHSGSNGSNQSDSDEDSCQDNTPPHPPPQNNSSSDQSNISPPPTPVPPVPQQPPQSPNKDHPTAFTPVAAREFFPSDTPEPNTNGRLLWDFLQQLLNDPTQRYINYIAWKNRETGVFKIVDPAGLAKLWGIQKNHLSMNYDKMSRALRYYYRVNILRKVQGERHCYQFLRNPSELKSIKNMSLLRQQMSPTRTGSASQLSPTRTNSMSQLSPTRTTHPFAIKMEPDSEEMGEHAGDEDLLPTDLSMSPSARQALMCKDFRLPNGLKMENIPIERIVYKLENVPERLTNGHKMDSISADNK